MKLLSKENLLSQSVLVLAAGGNPDNVRQCVDQLHSRCEAVDVKHLLFPEYCQKTDTLPPGAKKLMFIQKLRAAQASSSSSSSSSSSASSSSSSSSSSSQSSGSQSPQAQSSLVSPQKSFKAATQGSQAVSSAGGVQVKLEPNLPLAHRYRSSASAAEIPVLNPRYLDPETGDPETQEEHRLRYAVWASFFEPMLVHYPHILRDRGNIAAACTAIAAMNGQCTDTTFCDALIRLCNLEKDQSRPFSELAQSFADLRGTFETLGDSDLRLNDKILRLFSHSRSGS